MVCLKTWEYVVACTSSVILGFIVALLIISNEPKVTDESAIPKIQTEEIQAEVIEVLDDDTYRALNVKQGSDDKKGFEFHQERIWANELLKTGDKVEVILNSDTGELIYVMKVK